MSLPPWPGWLHPEWLASLALLWAILVAATVLAWLRARARARRLLGSGARARSPESARRDVALLAALLAVAVALLGPRMGTRSERLDASGVDVVVLVDVSQSMDARDVPPSRLDRARQAAGVLLAGLAPGDRAALAAFAGQGVLLTPLTPDHRALVELLPALDTSLVRPAASRLGEGVRAALGGYDPASPRPRVLVVLSDGEDADGTSDLGVVEARRDAVRVVAVALGTEAGTTIPTHGLSLRDRHDRIVTTRLDARRLARLAEATDGPLLRNDALGAVDAGALRAAVRRDAPAPGAPGGATGTVVRRVPAVRVLPFALAALVLLALEAGGGLRRGGAVAVLGLASALALGASTRDSDPQTLLSRGLALAERQAWGEAERAFRAAALRARDPALAAAAYHDAGVAALRAGRLEAARDAFFEAVALDPDDLPSRFNLEWTLRALVAEPPPPAAAEPSAEGEDEAPIAGEGEDEAPAPVAAETAPPTTTTKPGSERAPAPPQALDAEDVERWLARAQDDPARALRGLVPEERGPSRMSAW